MCAFGDISTLIDIEGATTNAVPFLRARGGGGGRRHRAIYRLDVRGLYFKSTRITCICLLVVFAPQFSFDSMCLPPVTLFFFSVFPHMRTVLDLTNYPVETRGALFCGKGEF